MAEVDVGAAVDICAPVLKSVPPLLAVQARVEALRQRGLAFARAKRFSEAENSLDEALETLQGQYDESIAGGVLIDLASVLEQRGDADSALTQLQEALRLLSRVAGVRERAYDGLLLLGRLGLRQRQFEPARQAFAAAIEEARRAGRVAAEAEARALMGALQQAQGNLDAAVVETESAIVLAEQVGDPVLEARLHQQLGRTLVALGRRGDAAAALSKALDRARRGQWDEGVSAAQQLLAVVGG
jgi:tetratricopeptide (TPR) repeat protein